MDSVNVTCGGTLEESQFVTASILGSSYCVRLTRSVGNGMAPPRVLTIAGSDSGGGAGIQADLKTFLSLGTYGLSVITALTAQNTMGVSAIHACPPEFVRKQLDAVSSDIAIDAVKIGMLCNEDIVNALVSCLKHWVNVNYLRFSSVPVVLDPVMVSTSGSLLLSQNAIETLITGLLPYCDVLTPNLPEARQLLRVGKKSDRLLGEDGLVGIDQMMQAAEEIADFGPETVLIKGGHASLTRSQIETWLAGLDGESEVIEVLPSSSSATDPQYPQRRHNKRPRPAEGEVNRLAGLEGACVTRKGNVTVIRTDELPNARILSYSASVKDSPSDAVVCDVLCQRTSLNRFTVFVKPKLQTNATHGTGCTLSSALAAFLAQGHTMLESTHLAIEYVQHAIAGGIQDLGNGHGPLDHSFPFQPRGLLFNRSDKSHLHEKFPFCRSLVSRSSSIWNAFVQHPFVLRLATGSLERASFLWFMKQDYIFLGHYARVWAQAATSLSNSLEDVAQFATMSQTMVSEANLHLQVCQDSFGISREELEHKTPESAATLSYTRFVMETGRSGDVLDLLVAVAPCMLGYAEVGLWLSEHQKPVDDPAYRAWIKVYSGQEFQEANQKAMALIEARALRDPPSPTRMAALQNLWNSACRLETAMWDEALDPTRQVLIVEP